MGLRTWLSLEGTAVSEREFTRLWTIAAATYGVGDIVTTIALRQFSPTVSEANIVVRMVTELFGQSGFVGLKLGVFLACILLSVHAAKNEDRFLYYLPPVVLSAVGAFTTALNIRLMLG